MKTKVLSRHLIFFLALSIVVFAGCSKDKDNTPDSGTDSFELDGTDYSINISSLVTQNDGSGLSKASIIITGNKGSEIGTITFLLIYYTTEGIDGTYTSHEGPLPAGGNYVNHLSTYGIQNGSDVKNGNYPQGDLKITSHGNNEYTIDFDLVYVDKVQASGNFRRTFTNP